MLCIQPHSHLAKRNIIWHSNTKPSSKQSNQFPTNKPMCFVFVSNLTGKTAHTRTHTFENNLSVIFSSLYMFAPRSKWSNKTCLSKQYDASFRRFRIRRRNIRFLHTAYSQCHHSPLSHITLPLHRFAICLDRKEPLIVICSVII